MDVAEIARRYGVEATVEAIEILVGTDMTFRDGAVTRAVRREAYHTARGDVTLEQLTAEDLPVTAASIFADYYAPGSGMISAVELDRVVRQISQSRAAGLCVGRPPWVPSGWPALFGEASA